MGFFTLDYGQEKILFKDSDGEPWVLAQSIYEAIDYKNGTRDVSRSVSAENRRKLTVPDNMRGRSGKRERIFLNQKGTTELLLKATRMPKAKPFRDWFFKTAVPQSMEALHLGALVPGGRQIAEISPKLVEAVKVLHNNQRVMFDQNREMLGEIREMHSILASVQSAMKIDGMNWRDAARYIINATAKKDGVDYRAGYHELYHELEELMHVKLSVRKANLLKKSGKKSLSMLDVIAADKKLIPTFVSVLRMYALRHGVNVEIKSEIQEQTKKGVA